jgi:hypothetical protein
LVAESESEAAEKGVRNAEIVSRWAQREKRWERKIVRCAMEKLGEGEFLILPK